MGLQPILDQSGEVSATEANINLGLISTTIDEETAKLLISDPFDLTDLNPILIKQIETKEHSNTVNILIDSGFANDDCVFKKPLLNPGLFNGQTSMDGFYELSTSKWRPRTSVSEGDEKEAIDASKMTKTTSITLLDLDKKEPVEKLSALKRNRKRSKLIANSACAANLVTKSSQTGKLSTLKATTDTDGIKQTKIGKQTKLSTPTQSSLIRSGHKKDKKEKIKHIKIANSALANFEPLNKKFAPDADIKTVAQTFSNNDLKLINLNSLSQKVKRDEVELHIKELSLLDLHSSEDDSAEILSKWVKPFLFDQQVFDSNWDI